MIPMCQHLPPKTSFRPQVRAKLMGAFAGTKMGTGRVETYLPSPHNPMVQWKISLKCKKTHIFDIGDTLNSIFPEDPGKVEASCFFFCLNGADGPFRNLPKSKSSISHTTFLFAAHLTS